MQDGQPTDAAKREYGAGIADAVILPLAVIGVAVKTLLRWAWRILVHVIDYIFPILLQIARFVLFTFRILGDAISALLRFIIKYLPLPLGRRQKWREAIARGWSWLRRKLSYRAFEEWIHHLFEDGMAWTFRTCRRLSPTGALLVILAAIVWIPISFTAATAAHVWLLANAASLPKWMQALNVVAALLAKSKLLMLPAYPAAWPQAKRHPIIQALARVWRYIAARYLVRKMIHRFGQVEDAMNRNAESSGLIRAWEAALAAIDRAAARTGAAVRSVVRPILRWLTRVPLLGPVVRTYESHYDRAGEAPPQRMSQRVRAFLDRWEMKFTPAYYETKEKEDAAKKHATPSADSRPERSRAS